MQTIWGNYTKAVAFLEAKVDKTGLMNVTGLRDWARLGGGGYNVEGNAILYKVSISSVLYFLVHNRTLIFAQGPNNSQQPRGLPQPNLVIYRLGAKRHVAENYVQ